MSGLADGFGGYLAILLIALLAHEPWRWCGLAIGSRLDPEGEIFKWVRAVSTALVAALVMRIVVFPSGAMAHVPVTVRVGAFAASLACFLLLGRRLWPAIGTGFGLLVLGKLVTA